MRNYSRYEDMGYPSTLRITCINHYGKYSSIVVILGKKVMEYTSTQIINYLRSISRIEWAEDMKNFEFDEIILLISTDKELPPSQLNSLVLLFIEMDTLNYE